MSSYMADGGTTKTPIDEKTNSLFGGGILGGLDLTGYLNDYSLEKSLNKPFGEGMPTLPKIEVETNYTLIAIIAVGVLLLIKTILD